MIKHLNFKQALSDALLFGWFLCALTYSKNVQMSFMISVSLLLWEVFFRSKRIGTIRIDSKKLIHILWLFLFWILCLLSTIWSMDSAKSMEVVIMEIRMFIGIISFLFYIHNAKSWIKAVNYLLIASLVMIGLIISNMPNYGYSYLVVQNATQLHFNTVAQMLAVLIVLAFFLASILKKKIYYIYIMSAYAIIIYTGSRKSLIFPLIVIALYSLLYKQNLWQKFQKIVLGLVIGVIIFEVISNNQMLWQRLENMVNALFSDMSADESYVERSFFRVQAIQMFLEKPILGYGVDGFKQMMQRIGYSHVAYSHNNYTEIASGLGITGVITYYWYYIYIMRCNFRKFMKKSKVAILTVIIVLVFMVFEYSIVSYTVQCYHIMFVLLGSMYYLYDLEEGRC